jgi:hypothetical protein
MDRAGLLDTWSIFNAKVMLLSNRAICAQLVAKHMRYDTAAAIEHDQTKSQQDKKLLYISQ